MIKDNLENILEEINIAREKSPYKQDVQLIAVSKTHPEEAINEAYACGIRDFGENKVQELCSKYDNLPKDIRWHLIGHLQTNKVKQVIGKVYLIHSVDSLKLAEEIEKQSAKAGLVTSILIQVNVSKEESKFGIETEDAACLVKSISKMDHVKVRGLMTIAPAVDNPEEVRQFFRQLRNLSIDIDALKIDNIDMEFLSMGMSGDYKVAIDEGATMVRIGTDIFGRRSYNI